MDYSSYQRRPPEARWKELEKLIKTTWDEVKGPASPPLNHCHEAPHQILLGWNPGFEGRSPLCPPLPGKAIKLFFSTLPETLSLRFYLALVYREAELSASKAPSHSQKSDCKRKQCLTSVCSSCSLEVKIMLIYLFWIVNIWERRFPTLPSLLPDEAFFCDSLGHRLQQLAWAEM